MQRSAVKRIVVAFVSFIAILGFAGIHSHAIFLAITAPADNPPPAAGNESRRNQDPRWVIAAAPPSSADGVISVGALRQTNDPGRPYRLAPFSNNGVNVVAPGFGVVSAKSGTRADLVAYNGTSMAAPHVAGVAALWGEKIRAETGELAHPHIIARLKGSAIAVNGLDAVDMGLGIVQAPQH